MSQMMLADSGIRFFISRFASQNTLLYIESFSLSIFAAIRTDRESMYGKIFRP
jgi:hypothetical protein